MKKEHEKWMEKADKLKALADELAEGGDEAIAGILTYLAVMVSIDESMTVYTLMIPLMEASKKALIKSGIVPQEFSDAIDRGENPDPKEYTSDKMEARKKAEEDDFFDKNDIIH